MGGKSSSSQSSSTKNVQTSQVNDGTYAGNTGRIDNSETDIDNSVDYREETDNSIDGDFNNNTGTVNVLDGGAIEEAFGFGRAAVDANAGVSEKAIEGAVKSQELALNFGEESIKQVGESANNFAAMMAELQKDNIQSNRESLGFLGEQSSENLEMVGELARNTALAGQDIVANQSTKIATYALIASGVFVVAMVFVIKVKK
jgi:hypothetical protein